MGDRASRLWGERAAGGSALALVDCLGGVRTGCGARGGVWACADGVTRDSNTVERVRARGDRAPGSATGRGAGRGLESEGESQRRRHRGRRKTDLGATWLILPVVICLCKRLSHARASIS